MFAEKYDTAFAEAAERNVPVLIIDPDGWSTDRSNPQLGDFATDKAFLEAAERAVLLLVSQEEHGASKELVDGVEREVCAAHGSNPCRVHRDLLPRVFSDFGRDGQLTSPLFAVAMPDRKLAARLEHEQKPLAVAAALTAAAGKLGAGMTRTDYLRIRNGLKMSSEFGDRGDLDGASMIGDELARIPGDLAPNRAVAGRQRELFEIASGSIAKARELWTNSRTLDALIRCDDIRAAFGKLAPAVEAAGLLVAWEKDEKSKDVLATYRADQSQRQKYRQAVAAWISGDLPRATQLADRLLKSDSESRFATRAKTLMEQFSRATANIAPRPPKRR